MANGITANSNMLRFVSIQELPAYLYSNLSN
jgi:hypothetical protein